MLSGQMHRSCVTANERQSREFKERHSRGKEWERAKEWLASRELGGNTGTKRENDTRHDSLIKRGSQSAQSTC